MTSMKTRRPHLEPAVADTPLPQYPEGVAYRKPYPPVVDRERGDHAWQIARRREWGAQILAEQLHRRRRILAQYPTDSPARAARFSTRDMVVHWRPREDGTTPPDTHSLPPSLIPEQLAAWLVTHLPLERILLEGDTGLWHPLPMTPGAGRVDRNRS